MKKIILMISIILFFYCLLNISIWIKDNKHTKEIITEINKGINPSDSDRIVDINYLIKMNKDTVSFLIVRNTNIRYPIVQTKNNSYYLNHSFDKTYSSSGWPFMDYKNNKDLTDQNTVIYAHARKDNSMFGTLKNTIKKNWYLNKSNHIITLITKDKTIHYQVFSTYTIKDEDYYIQTNIKDYSTFLKTITKRSVYNYNLKPNTSDLILTLSTCYTNNKKVVLHAKRLD